MVKNIKKLIKNLKNRHELNKVERNINSLNYPFLDNIDNDNKKEINYLQQIDTIARNAYSNNLDDLFTFEKLSNIYEKSKESWKVIKEEEIIKGYIHVCSIDKDTGTKLKAGEINENNILVENILNDTENKDGYIYIGSIVLKEYPSSPFSKDKYIYKLLAGTIDRIIELRKKNQKLKQILAVAYKDKTGDNHFLKFLPMYGFVKIGETKDNDPVFELNIEENKNRNFTNLFLIVSSKINKEISINNYKRKILYFLKNNKRQLISLFQQIIGLFKK